jgi:hypothetical protein
MRKLLLGTTALAAAATLSANAALADVSIAGYYEWKMNSQSSDITSQDGTSFSSDSEITFKFSNKTDSGLDIGFVAELSSDGGEGAMDESSMSIAGGFGKIVLGSNDDIGDSGYGVAASDLITEEDSPNSTTSGIMIKNADIYNTSADNNKVSYHLPAMGGLTAGISYEDSGEAGSADATAVGFKYSMEAGGAAVTLGAVSSTTENATQDIDSQVVGVQVTSGNISAIVSQATYEASGSDEESNGAAISFKVSDALSVIAYTAETDDSSDSEEYTNTGVEAVYQIASGLTAVVTVEDYDYKVGSHATGTADPGTKSKLTIKASF